MLDILNQKEYPHIVALRRWKVRLRVACLIFIIPFQLKKFNLREKREETAK